MQVPLALNKISSKESHACSAELALPTIVAICGDHD